MHLYFVQETLAFPSRQDLIGLQGLQVTMDVFMTCVPSSCYQRGWSSFGGPASDARHCRLVSNQYQDHAYNEINGDNMSKRQKQKIKTVDFLHQNP